MAAGVAAFAVALSLTACGGAGGSSDGKLRLVAADYGETSKNSSKNYWNAVAKAFQKKHPDIEVEVRVINWDDIDQQVKTMIQNGDVPDMVQTGGYADKVADDLLYKAEEVLSPQTRKNLIPSFAEAGEVDGTQYGIPFTSSTRALFYNKRVFSEAGVEEPPETWGELKAAAERIEGADAAPVPYALPLGPEEAQGETMMWQMGNGGGYTGADGEYTLDSQANTDTFRWLKRNLVDPGLTYQNPAATDRKTAFADFAAGKAGMLNGHPTLIQMAEKGEVDYGVAPIPGRKGQLKSSLGVADWMMAFKDGGKREEVRKFLDFAYSKKNMLKFGRMYNMMPVTEDALKEMEDSGDHRELEPFFAMLPDAKFYPLDDPSWDAVSAQIKKTGGTAVKDDPKKVFGDLQKKAEQAASER